ncbi:MAG: VWA domain-containing protein [Bryobacteraceae bacterium]
MRKVIIPSIFCLVGLSAAETQQPGESGAVIRATVTEVALDLVVRDNRGRVVRNLQPSDIEVYENGVRQQVRSLRLIAGREAGQAAKSGANVPGAPAPFALLRAVNLVCLVFHDMNPATRKYTLEAAREFVKNPFPPDTYVGVFSLASGLTPLVGFTNNRDELMQAAANAFVGRQVDFASSATAVLNAGGGAINARAVTGADVETGGAANARRADLANSRRQFIGIEGARGMDQMKEMIQMLGQLPGRKSVLLLSPGLAVTGDPDKFKAIVDAANRADITVYAIDTNGMTENSSVLASSTLLGGAAGPSAGPGGMGPDDSLHDAVRTSNAQAPLRALAEGTGGFLAANTNDLRKSFERIVGDVDTHYEVIYHPANATFDGRFRKIEVKVTRAGLNVDSRPGYFALPDAGIAPPAPYETAALTALGSESKPRVFDFQAAAYQFRPEGAATQYTLAFEVPAANLTATALTQAKKQRLHVALLALVKDANGQVVDKISQDFPFEFPENQMPAVRADAIRYSRPVKLAPGHYSMETAIVDRESNRTTTDTIEFDNPAHKGLGMSSILLVQSVQPLTAKADPADPLEFEHKRVSPELVTDLKPGAQPYVYFVVYPDKANAEKPSIQVEVLNNGKSLAKQTTTLPAADATGAIPMVVIAPRQPGRCELKITAMQGGESVERRLAYTVPAKQQQGKAAVLPFNKVNEGRPNAVDLLKAGSLHLVIYTTTGGTSFSDEQAIRRSAITYRIPCITTMSGARAAVQAIASRKRDPVRVWNLQEIHAK